MNDIRIEQWDLVRFNNSQEEWSNLLERSSSDKLFMSWEWLYTWWSTFATHKDMTLKIFAAYNQNNDLVGIAPLYLITTKSKNFFKTRRLQFLGNCWRGKSTMRTELQDFIVDKSYSKQIIKAIFLEINYQSCWDEFVLSELAIMSDTYFTLMENKLIKNSYYRYAERFQSYFLQVGSSFKDYCNGLGKNTRLKFLNRRNILDKIGSVEFTEGDVSNIESNFALLNSLHNKRWGEAVFEGDRLTFNLNVAKLMSKKGQLNFSILSVDGLPISIQYNYLIDKHEYNIQAGFDESFHNKISLGYLHFGYAIEASFNRGDRIYDFLAGEGKKTQYKERLTTTTLDVVSLQIVRKKYLKLLYRIFDYFNGLRG